MTWFIVWCVCGAGGAVGVTTAANVWRRLNPNAAPAWRCIFCEEPNPKWPNGYRCSSHRDVTRFPYDQLHGNPKALPAPPWWTSPFMTIAALLAGPIGLVTLAVTLGVSGVSTVLSTRITTRLLAARQQEAELAAIERELDAELPARMASREANT